VAFAKVLPALSKPNLPQNGTVLISYIPVEESAHRVGRALHGISSADLTDQVAAEVKVELEAVEQAELGDLSGRARQAVALTRADASPTQVAAADRLLYADPLGSQESVWRGRPLPVQRVVPGTQAIKAVGPTSPRPPRRDAAVVPSTIVSLDDLNPAMLADSAFYPGFCLLKPAFRCLPLDRCVLAHVSDSRDGIERDNLVDYFDCVAVLQRLQRIEGPVYLHISKFSGAAARLRSRTVTISRATR
jgi:hypothetical protein